MGEGCEQQQIIVLLLSVLQELARQRGWGRTFIGSDAFFAWRPEHPLVRVSPDAYLLDDPPGPPLPCCWQTWLPGHHPPRWAVEIVSDDWRKDYDEAPAKYSQLGCRELVLFDPDVARGAVKSKVREPLTIYRRGEDGLFVRVYSGGGPAYSAELEVWLHVRLEGPVARLRLFLDEAGEQLVPTATERAEAEAERAEAQAERAEAEAERAEAEARARIEAERRVRELEEKLRQLEASRS